MSQSYTNPRWLLCCRRSGVELEPSEAWDGGAIFGPSGDVVMEAKWDWQHGDPWLEVSESNMRLILRSPELLESLDEMCEFARWLASSPDLKPGGKSHRDFVFQMERYHDEAMSLIREARGEK